MRKTTHLTWLAVLAAVQMAVAQAAAPQVSPASSPAAGGAPEGGAGRAWRPGRTRRCAGGGSGTTGAAGGRLQAGVVESGQQGVSADQLGAAGAVPHHGTAGDERERGLGRHHGAGQGGRWRVDGGFAAVGRGFSLLHDQH